MIQFSGVQMTSIADFNIFELTKTIPLLFLFFIDFAIAYPWRYSPQWQLFVLSIPVKCLVGLASLTIYLIALFQFMEKEIVYFGDIIRVFL